MPEKSHERKLRSDASNCQSDIEVACSFNEENLLLSEQDFEDISNTKLKTKSNSVCATLNLVKERS